MAYPAGADRRSLCCMSTAAVAVGHWLVIILVVTSVVMRVQRNRLRRQRDEMRRSRVRRQRDETPEDRYRREPPDLRRSQTSLGGGSDAADAPRPVVGADDLAALVQRAVHNAPERELVGDYRRLRRAKRRRKVWAAGTAGAAGVYYSDGHSGFGEYGGGDGGCGDGGGCGGGGEC